MAEVAEPLVVEPLVAVALEQRPNGGNEPVAWNQIGIQRPQPRAEHTAAYEQAVLVQRTTDEREVGGVGSRAPVGHPVIRTGRAASATPNPSGSASSPAITAG